MAARFATELCFASIYVLGAQPRSLAFTAGTNRMLYVTAVAGALVTDRIICILYLAHLLRVIFYIKCSDEIRDLKCKFGFKLRKDNPSYLMWSFFTSFFIAKGHVAKLLIKLFFSIFLGC